MTQDSTTTSRQTKTEPASSGKNQWLQRIVFSFMVAIPVSILSILTYDHYFAPKIMVVDFKGFLEKQRKLFLSGNIDEETLKRNLTGLQVKIQSQPSNIIILNKETVLNDAKALTE